MRFQKLSLFLFFLLVVHFACRKEISSDEQMIRLLADARKTFSNHRNLFDPVEKLAYYDSLIEAADDGAAKVRFKYIKAIVLLELAEEQRAIDLFEELMREMNEEDNEASDILMADLALAYMRLGEQVNCNLNHSAESCIIPIMDKGVHTDQTGSRKAIELYTAILEQRPDDLESRWLMNIAYMTIGGYPHDVPHKYLIAGLDSSEDGSFKPFKDIAPDLGLDVRNMSGGSIVDDFDNDGYLDIILSSWSLSEPMHYFRNNGDGTFSDHSISSGLHRFTGGLNLLQADYNNDGWKDIFVLRGAWLGAYGLQPNSLLRNNGDGTFTDVTTISGLLCFHPTQTATWNDFNNDGWLDIFIGNETNSNVLNPCQLFINNRDGTFTLASSKTGTAIIAYVKAVTSGDYDNDGWPDIFVSTMDGNNRLLRNKGVVDGELLFEDVTQVAGLGDQQSRTFPTWFWDYDNDGWLDIFVCGYEFYKSIGYYEAAQYLDIPTGGIGKMHLYRNNGDGTFKKVTDEVNLYRNVFAMGSNFGDVDNDGYLDFYLGTGNPNFKSLVPNRLFRNENGKRFTEVTTPARVGHLQKGHGISFADLNNDGNLDIYVNMGGSFIGDAYQSSFFLNPGQNTNNWISLILEGTTANRDAVGARIKVTIIEEGVRRSIFRDMNSGGSFGASPLRSHIGIGKAEKIEKIEIRWPGTNEAEVISDLEPNQILRIKQGSSHPERIVLNTLQFDGKQSQGHHH